MRQIFLYSSVLFNVFVNTTLFGFTNYASALDVGSDAPPFCLKSKNGKELSLTSYKGQIVYVDFWASWCIPCRLSFPWMNKIHQKYGALGVKVIAVNLDKKRIDAEEFMSLVPHEFSVAYDPDGSTPQEYGVKAMPTSYLIGRDGKILSTHKGFTDSTAEDVEREILVQLGATK